MRFYIKFTEFQSNLPSGEYLIRIPLSIANGQRTAMKIKLPIHRRYASRHFEYRHAVAHLDRKTAGTAAACGTCPYYTDDTYWTRKYAPIPTVATIRLNCPPLNHKRSSSKFHQNKSPTRVTAAWSPHPRPCAACRPWRRRKCILSPPAAQWGKSGPNTWITWIDYSVIERTVVLTQGVNRCYAGLVALWMCKYWWSYYE